MTQGQFLSAIQSVPSLRPVALPSLNLPLPYYLPIGGGVKRWINDIYLTSPLEQDMTQGRFFKRSLTGFNSEFSFS